MCFLVGSKVIQAQYKAMGVLPCNGWGAMKDRRLVVGVLYPFEQAHCKSWDMLNVRLRKHVVSLGADGQVVGEEPIALAAEKRQSAKHLARCLEAVAAICARRHVVSREKSQWPRPRDQHW